MTPTAAGRLAAAIEDLNKARAELAVLRRQKADALALTRTDALITPATLAAVYGHRVPHQGGEQA